MDDNHQITGQEIGRLQAQVGILSEQVAEIAKTLRAIELDLASAKGSAKVVIGVSVLLGGAASFLLEKAVTLMFLKP
jgi:hypothetical protein